jgi:hypothetical protein
MYNLSLPLTSEESNFSHKAEEVHACFTRQIHAFKIKVQH